MAYQNPFPATYQPINYPQQYQTQMQPQQQAQPLQSQASQNNPMIWVQGETGAKSYLLAPNTTLPLWDSERQTIYLKSADASGMPSMKVLDYTIRNDSQPQAPIQSESQSPDFVTHEELKLFEDRITNALEEVRHESRTSHSNGRRPKKQSGIDAE